MSVLVNWRTFCVEVSSRDGLERKVMKILAGVGSNFPENGKDRKSTVSLAIYVS
jgi:hypothetical protein